MSREAALKLLLESPAADSDLLTRITRIEENLDLLLSVIVVQQKDACSAAGVTDDTVRRKVLSGEVEVLQRDGSNLNYLTLKQTGELKKRRRGKRKN